VLDPSCDSADYELTWPRELFARELAAVRASAPATVKGQERIEFPAV